MLEGEEKCIRDAQAGSVEGFTVLYEHYVPPIYRFIYLKVSHRQEAEDLTHDVFASAWQHLGAYEPRGFPLSSWLYQIARNRIIDYYRARRANVPLEAVEARAADVNLEEAVDGALDLEAVRRAIRTLTHDQQDVLILRFVEELPHREIAATLGKTEGAVRLLQHRALAELKKRFPDRGGTDRRTTPVPWKTASSPF